MNAQLWAIALSVVGGLGVFMLGMKHMSEGMQAVAGNSLRRMISIVTNNPLMATAAGTGVTLLVQSSSITTVIIVGLVNAGLMQLHQAVGVIMGANIGTTITGWVLVLQIGKYGLPMLGAAALVYLFARGDRMRFIAMAIMGMGMVFFGLELMKNGFAPMKDMPMFVEAFAWFDASTYAGVYKAVLVGCILTFIVQSSSATLGITIGLAATGVIPFTTAAALVLGENIGTTITIILASLGANTNARRAAAAHVLFNVIGAAWITLLFPWYSRLIAAVIQSLHGADPITMTMADFADPAEFAAVMTAGIALTHTVFNVANTMLFLPFVRPYSRLLERIIPDPHVKEVARLKRFDAPGVSAPVLRLEQSRGEVIQMGEIVRDMGKWIRQLGFHGPWDETLLQKTFRREEILDNMQGEVVKYLTDVLDSTVPHAVADEGRKQLRIAHEYESISDRLASALRSFERLRQKRLELGPDHLGELLELHDLVMDFTRRAVAAYATGKSLTDGDARAASDAVNGKVRTLQNDHMQRMIDGPIDPNLTMIFTTLLTDYRRIRAHALNVHEATAGSMVNE
ncbi:Na/Pi cotransporter family protein [soil metagenome]